MDFDEYDYLEKTVENPDIPKDSANGNAVKSGERDGRDRISSLKHNDENGRDGENRVNRARSEEEPRERMERGDRGKSSHDGEHWRHRERSVRSSSFHRSSPDHRSRDDRSERDLHRSNRERFERSSRDRDRDYEERNGRERGRERGSRDRERDRRDRDHDNERDKERERERSHRSRSRSERHRSDRDRDADQEMVREKSRDIESRERERERDLRDKDGRRLKEKKDEAAEPEADPERDQRTVFAYQICLKADERDVYEFFSRAGKVRDVRLIMDRNSRRSKGVGYIEFYDAMSVPMAIALSGQLLLGQPVMVKPSEAEKNLVQSTTAVVGGAGGFIGPYSGGARRLYVGNLHFNITEDQLRQVFEPFGPVELVQLPLDPETGHCKGFGFVQFVRLEDARAAQSLNGQLDIAGRIIKVSAVSDQVGMQDIGANAGDFDDDDGGGLSLNARSRAILMQKLDRSGVATSIAGSLGTPVVNGPPLLNLPAAPVPGIIPAIAPLVPSLGQAAAIPALAVLPGSGIPVAPVAIPAVDTIGVPSECLLLKNMFDPKIETEPDFDVDIKEDVEDECSKFGTVKHIFVDKDSAGHVYLRFDAAASAIGAQRALHGRWFAGKMITATFMTSTNYEAKFPTSK